MMMSCFNNKHGTREEDMKKALLCAGSALVLAWSSLAHAQQPTAGNLEKLSGFKTTGTPMDIPQISADRIEGGSDQEKPRSDQAAKRIQDRSLCPRAGCSPHRGRAAGRGGVRRHTQEQGVGRDRPRQGPRGRRGQGVRAVDQLYPSKRGVLLQRRLFLHRRAESRPRVPCGRVLLRRPGCRRLRRREAGGADPSGGGIL